MARLRIFHAADLHGSDRCFRKLLNAAKFYGAHALILGGDVTGKVVVPFVENPDGTYRTSWGGRTRLTPTEVDGYERNFLNSGIYSVRVSAPEMDELEAKPDAVYALFNRLMRERLDAWLALADERLRAQNLYLYAIPGNDDRFEIDDAMHRAERVIYCENRVVEVDGYEMASLGWTNPTPWHTPRELPEDQLEARLRTAVESLRRPERAIFNFHCPPSDTALDLAPHLTPDFKVVSRGGAVQMQHVGSGAVRRTIERVAPMLSLHGHIHESRGEERIGRTLCLNPGSEYSQGILPGVLVDIEDGRVVRHQFTTG